MLPFQQAVSPSGYSQFLFPLPSPSKYVPCSSLGSRRPRYRASGGASWLVQNAIARRNHRYAAVGVEMKASRFALFRCRSECAYIEGCTGDGAARLDIPRWSAMISGQGISAHHVASHPTPFEGSCQTRMFAVPAAWMKSLMIASTPA